MIPILSRFRTLESDLRASLERESNLHFVLDQLRAKFAHVARENERLRDERAERRDRR